MKRALITGITGQDGSHLAEFLLEKGYHVFGTTRQSSPETLFRIRDILDRIELHQGDLLDSASMDRVLETVQPDEIYNLASTSFVPASWQQPVLTADYTAVGVTRILESMRRLCPQARFYQASSSEMFGKVREMPQDENTPFHPRSPYGVAKVFGHHITVNYRDNYNLFATSGILFNHEGPRRGLEFVTRKITHAVARIKLGLASELRLGNLEARRDWGYAGDFVRSMWRMLQQDRPEDFVIGTGETHSVQEFVEIAFDRAGLDWRPHVVVDPKFYRPVEPNLLVADSTKARRILGWQPKTSFADLIKMMVDADMDLLLGRRPRQRPRNRQPMPI